MTEREKVISDVISAFDDWENNRCCPGEDWSDVHQSRDMVIALLKAQEPKVMTLEYFDNSPDKDSKGCLVAWVEYRRDEEWAEYWEGTRDEWSVIRRDDFYSRESYRFWTSRPTDEQRKAIPWN